MLGVAADVKTTIGEGDECERGQLTNFWTPRVVSISISLNAPVPVVLGYSMIFSPRIINLSFDPPITSVCYEWCKVNSERWFRLNPYVRLYIHKMCRFRYFALVKCCCCNEIHSLFSVFFLNALYSYFVNITSRNKNWQIVKCSSQKFESIHPRNRIFWEREWIQTRR